MKASRYDVATWTRALADIAAKLGAAEVDGATAVEQEAIDEATAKVAHAALILEQALSHNRP